MDAALHLKVPVSDVLEMSMPLVELVIQRQSARDAERDLAQLRVVNAAASPLTGSKEGSEIFNELLALLARKATGGTTAPNSAFSRLLAHARKQQAKRGRARRSKVAG